MFFQWYTKSYGFFSLQANKPYILIITGENLLFSWIFVRCRNCYTCENNFQKMNNICGSYRLIAQRISWEIKKSVCWEWLVLVWGRGSKLFGVELRCLYGSTKTFVLDTKLTARYTDLTFRVALWFNRFCITFIV